MEFSIILYNNFNQRSLDLLLDKIKETDWTDSFKFDYGYHYTQRIRSLKRPPRRYIIIKYTCDDPSIGKTIKELASGLKFRVTTQEAFDTEFCINETRYEMTELLSILPVIRKCQIPTNKIKTFTKWYTNISKISAYNFKYFGFYKQIEEEKKEHLCKCAPYYDDGTANDCNGVNYWCYYCNVNVHKFNAVLQEINVRRICQMKQGSAWYKIKDLQPSSSIPLRNQGSQWYRWYLILNTNLDVYYNIHSIHEKQGVHYHLKNRDKPHIIDKDGNFQLYRKNQRSGEHIPGREDTARKQHPIWPVRCGCCKLKVIWVQ